MQHVRWKKSVIVVMASGLPFVTFPAVSYAGLIGTAEMLAADARASAGTSVRTPQQAAIRSALARDDVRAQMLAMGVSPAEVEQRLDALTDAELAQLSAEMDRLPAGAGVLEVIGVVFVVLLILELLHVTNIFTGL
jgi:hypothetical protein